MNRKQILKTLSIVALDMLLYGALLVLVYSIVVDKAMSMGNAQLQLEFISEKKTASVRRFCRIWIAA